MLICAQIPNTLFFCACVHPRHSLTWMNAWMYACRPCLSTPRTSVISISPVASRLFRKHNTLSNPNLQRHSCITPPVHVFGVHRLAARSSRRSAKAVDDYRCGGVRVSGVLCPSRQTIAVVISCNAEATHHLIHSPETSDCFVIYPCADPLVAENKFVLLQRRQLEGFGTFVLQMP